MWSEEFFIAATENVFAVFLLVLAYKIYHSKCHTYIRSKLLNLEISENIPRGLEEDFEREISTN